MRLFAIPACCFIAAAPFVPSRSAHAQSLDRAIAEGTTQLEARNTDAAISAFSAAVRENDRSSVAHYWLGAAYAQQASQGGLFSRGRAASRMKGEWERAVELDSNNYAAHRGLYLMASEAPAIFGGGTGRMARERVPMLRLQPVDAVLVFAMESQRHGKPEEAVRYLQPLVAQCPDSLPIRRVLVSALEDAHRVDDAWRALDAAVGRFGQRPELDFLLGRGAAISNTRVAEGTAALQRLLQLSPAAVAGIAPAGALQYRLGMIAEHAGRIDEARRQYQAAVSRDGKNDTYRDALNQLPRA